MILSLKTPFLQSVALMALAAGLSACSILDVPGTGAQSDEPTINPVTNLQAVPEGTQPDDKIIGQREHPRIIKNFGGVYQDREVELMLASMVARLMRSTDNPNQSFTVTILDSEEVNAFASPGGFVYVTRGALALANDLSQIAAVIAHEMAHVTLRHARERAARARTSQVAGRVVAMLGGDAQNDPAVAKSKLSLAAFSQQQELAADAEGIRLAAAAGYQPQSAEVFLGAMQNFARLGKKNIGSHQSNFLSSHPTTPQRIVKARAVASDVSMAAPARQDMRYYLEKLDGLSFGPDSDLGIIKGRLYLNPKRRVLFEAPENYHLKLDRQTIVGVGTQNTAFRMDSVRENNKDPIAYMKSGWVQGLRPESIKRTRVNGLIQVQAQAQSGPWQFEVRTVHMDGFIYRIVFAAKNGAAKLGDDATYLSQQFRRARNDDVKSIKPPRLRVVRARATDTPKMFIDRMAVGPNKADLFYVLNHLRPGQALKAGALYKIIVQ